MSIDRELVRSSKTVTAAAVFTIALSIAGCGGSTTSSPTATPVASPAASPTDAPTASPSPTPGWPVVVSSTPAATTQLADVADAVFRLIGDPDWIVAFDGFIWIKGDNGFVTKIDPATNSAVDDVHSDTKSNQLCQGIGAGGGYIFSCSGSDVVQIDPDTVEVLKSIPIAKVYDQGRLVFAADNIWVLTHGGDQLVGIDAATGAVGSPIDLPVACNDLGPGVATVWILCPNEDLVLKFDPVGRSIQGQVELRAPASAFGTETDLWVGTADGLARLDSGDLHRIALFEGFDPTLEVDVGVDDNDVWYRTPTGFLHRIDASTNTVEEQYIPDEAVSGGSVIVFDGFVWTDAFNDALVVRLHH